MSMRTTRLVWHRRDLRLHDNALYENVMENTNVVAVYIFNEVDFQPRKSTVRNDWWTVNTGPFAARLEIEAVKQMRGSIRRIGGELIVRMGCPATILSDLVQELRPDQVVWNEEPGVYESRLSEQVWKAIRKVNPTVPIGTNMQYTLYHPDDLPRGNIEWSSFLAPQQSKKKKKQSKNNGKAQTVGAPPSTCPKLNCGNTRDSLVNTSPERWKGMPRIMSDFRKAAREATKPRPCLEPPTEISLPESLPPPGEIPTLMDLCEPVLKASTKTNQLLLGMSADLIRRIVDSAQREPSPPFGEDVALSHLANFCENHASHAARNLACVDDNQSSRISHFLAFGCLSPRKVIEEAERHGEGCQWMISHMTMRDFFLFTCLASGSRFYRLEGIPLSLKHNKRIYWKDLDDETAKDHWLCWASGRTGLPLVDAAMAELMSTGYCSNRVRQNVASMLTKDLHIDWRAGAEWFQFLLQDHCVGASWGNWLYFSGVGPDPKQRHFRTVSQALKYDPRGDYVKKWLPQLARSSEEEAFLRPWDFDEGWKRPIVSPETQYTWQDAQRLSDEGSLIPQPGTENITK